MDSISFRCSSCKQLLKANPEKAGRKIKCGKCAAEQIVPSPSPEEKKPLPAHLRKEEKKPEAERKPPPPVNNDDEVDDKKGYGFFVDLKEEEERKKKEAEERKPKKKEKAATIKKKYKILPEADKWQKVRAALRIMLVGVYVWAGALGFHVIFVLCGMFSGPVYMGVVEEILVAGQERVEDYNVIGFLIGAVTGSKWVALGRGLLILATVLILVRSVVWLAGYIAALPIPGRFGVRGQLSGLISLAILNGLINLVFRLLCLAGAVKFLLIPYLIPEVSLINAAVDRSTPMWVFWSGAAFGDLLLSLLLIFIYCAEPILLGVFLWSVGTALREDPISEAAQVVVNLAIGVAFTLLAFHLLSIVGSTSVLVWVLRISYFLGLLFTAILMVRLIICLNLTGKILDKYLIAANTGDASKDDQDEENDEPRRKRRDDDDEEDEEEGRPRRAKRRLRDEEEDEDEDD